MDLTPAYDNAAAVPGAASMIAGWASDSAALRSARGTHLDIAYGSDARARWDVFPSDMPDAPCLLFVHGGYWQKNSREAFACMVEGALARGWSAALPGYPLAPDASMTQIAEHLRAALDFLAEERAALGIRGPVVLAGWSAGAHLCALHADHPVVDAVVAISGIFDLGPIARTAFNDALRLSDAEIDRLSPLRAPASSKPLLVAFGGGELPELQRQSLEFSAQNVMSGHGLVISQPVPGLNHFTILDALRSPTGALWRHIDLLLAMAAIDQDETMGEGIQ